MVDKTFILKDNSEEIRRKITDAGILVCPCSKFDDSDWLVYSTAVGNGVHGEGYPFEGMTKEQTRALFLHDVKNPIWCENVDEFIKKIKAHEEAEGLVIRNPDGNIWYNDKYAQKQDKSER